MDTLIIDFGHQQTKQIDMRTGKTDIFYSFQHEQDDDSQVFGADKQIQEDKPYVTIPILQGGQFSDIKLLEKTIRHISPNQQHKDIVLCFAKQLNETYREKMYQILFEKFDQDKVSINWQAHINKYVQGVVNKVLIVDCGYHQTNVIPVLDDQNIRDAKVENKFISGHALDRKIINFQMDRGIFFNPNVDMKTIEDIKNKFQQFSLDDSGQNTLMKLNRQIDKQTLPDQSILEVDSEKYVLPEYVFNHEGENQSTLVDLIFDSLEKTPVECRLPVLNNIVISGGMFMLKNMKERLEQEIEDAQKDRIAKNSINLKVNIIDLKDKDQNLFPLKGMRDMVENFSMFEDNFITKEAQYER